MAKLSSLYRLLMPIPPSLNALSHPEITGRTLVHLEGVGLESRKPGAVVEELGINVEI
jgi:hypothetical protein